MRKNETGLQQGNLSEVGHLRWGWIQETEGEKAGNFQDPTVFFKYSLESIHESCMIFIRKFWKICDAFFPFSISGWMCFSSGMFFPKDALYESRDHGEAIEKRPKHSDWQKCSNEVDKVGNLLEKRSIC